MDVDLIFLHCGGRNFSGGARTAPVPLGQGGAGADDDTRGLIVVLMLIVQEIDRLFTMMKNVFGF